MATLVPGAARLGLLWAHFTRVCISGTADSTVRSELKHTVVSGQVYNIRHMCCVWTQVKPLPWCVCAGKGCWMLVMQGRFVVPADCALLPSVAARKRPFTLHIPNSPS